MGYHATIGEHMSHAFWSHAFWRTLHAPSLLAALGLALCVAACGSSEESTGAGGSGGTLDCGCAGSAGQAGDGAGGTAGAGGATAELFRPTAGTSWQWQLTGLPIDTSFDVAAYDVDLFETSDADLATLRNAGRAILCYFSAGSYESFRPDVASFPAEVKGNPLDPPFEDELWLDINSPVVRQIMQARLDLAVTRGCDAVEPDNVDGSYNDSGFGLTPAEQLDYNRFIAGEAHLRNLSVGLKNDIDQLDDLVADFDWALNEECYTYAECDAYSPNFLAANKAVFHAEYVAAADLDAVCAASQPLGLSTLLKNIELDAWQLPCP
jgi:hypothetical protein